MISKDKNNLMKNMISIYLQIILLQEKQLINMVGIGDQEYLQLVFGNKLMFNLVFQLEY
jgi:hypothetical protein